MLESALITERERVNELYALLIQQNKPQPIIPALDWGSRRKRLESESAKRYQDKLKQVEEVANESTPS